MKIMKMTINAGMAQEMFKNYDRNYYTYEALETLLEWYDEIDPNAEFDVIGICCEWNEYGETPCLSWKDFISDYGYLLSVEEWEENNEQEYNEDLYIDSLIEALEDKTVVLRLSNSVLVMAF